MAVVFPPDPTNAILLRRVKRSARSKSTDMTLVSDTQDTKELLPALPRQSPVISLKQTSIILDRFLYPCRQPSPPINPRVGAKNYNRSFQKRGNDIKSVRQQPDLASTQSPILIVVDNNPLAGDLQTGLCPSDEPFLVYLYQVERFRSNIPAEKCPRLVSTTA